MTLILDDDQQALAESVAAFARRAAPVSVTRAELEGFAKGTPAGGSWSALIKQGLHTIHLPDAVGGAACGLPTLAVVVEQLGRALFPGAYVPTVITSMITALARNGREPLDKFAAGATGAPVRGQAITARTVDHEWVIDGVSEPTLGLPGADLVIVQARVTGDAGTSTLGLPADGYLWFWIEGAGNVATTPRGAELTVCEPADLTRSVGTLTFDNYVVAQDHALHGIDLDTAELCVNALLAAEASGIAAWCLDTAVDYIRTRHQFGRPVGAFQAVQHKAALMLVRSEVITAAAWDAARAYDDPASQQRLASGHATVTALPNAIDQALECISLLGGIGFTWEHDAHLYWRRAISIASAAGAEDRWATKLGNAALDDERAYALIDADTQPELRARVGAILDRAAAMPDDDVPSPGWAPPRGGQRRAYLASEGLTAPHYPAPYGLDAGPREQAIISEEFDRRELRQPEMGIAEWVLPTVLEHGTPEQLERFVAPTLCGEIIWCQLFSEPGAGSDLAGLSTRARRVDGGWVLSGQKVWNSQAKEADWGVCLARTDTDAAKHAGLTYFLIDMRAQGVDVRPLRQATGIWEFNEVFLDDVFVPDECVVGEPGQGWRLAVTTLANERLNMGSVKLGHGSANMLRQLIDRGDHGCSREEAIRVLGRNTAREQTIATMNLRNVLRRLHGVGAGSDGGNSVQKVYHAIAQRDGSRAVVSALGPIGCVGHPEQPYVRDYLGVPAVMIGGGTIEIQLNVIAQRVLGLPR